MEADLINFVLNQGVAVAVLAFVLIRLEKSMKKVEDALIQVAGAVVRMEALYK